MSGADGTRVSRRGFVRGASAAAAGLVIGFYVPEGVARAAGPKNGKAKGDDKDKSAPPLPPPNAFVRIAPDDTVTVVLAHSEMGQGIWTTLAMLVAEELDCDWSKVRSEHAPAAAVYQRAGRGIQMTGGSSTTRGELERYRTVGAAAKDMLVRAAAARLKAKPDDLVVEKGVIKHGKRSLRFGEVAEDAMKLAPPASVKLKDAKAWKLLGKPMRRLDAREKVTGKAEFGIDVNFPGLRTALVLRAPAFGATIARVDDAAARKIPGVESVVRVESGVAVVAKHFWAAKLGRDALVVEWRAPEGGGASSDAMLAEARKLAQTSGSIVQSVGDAAGALAAAKSTHVAELDVPFLAHAPMEPLNCVVKIDGDRCSIWTGTQAQTFDQRAAAEILGTTIDKVDVHTTFLGGGFGRRASPRSDFVREAVHVAKAAGVPVKVVWTREDDLRGGYYRPAYVHRATIAVDAKGEPVAWDHVVVGQSILAGTPLEGFGVKNGIDHASVEGVAESPYLDAVRDKRISLHTTKSEVPVLWWRSVGNTHSAFVMETLVDELAHAAKRDPLEYRLALLANKPRFKSALELAAKKAGWGSTPPAGRARGLAIHESFGSIVAEVAEVSVDGERVRVHRVTCVVDCGAAVNPLGVEAQIQGSVVYGLTAALYGKITVKDGRVAESNFHDYPPLRMHEMPAIDVTIVESGAPMGGIGEPATAPIAPAVANAVFALTQKRLRTLPLRLA